MNKNLGKKIGVIGNQSTTIDLIQTLLEKRYKISCIITMPSDLGGKISGYVDISPIAKKHKIPLVHAHSFTLTDEKDKKKINSFNLDLLLVFGWQRLIPEWLLKSLCIGAFGSHGSWKKLPYGRGRSLLNWSLILGKNKLIDNFFRYDAGADSGDIVESFTFQITPYDTISSLHHKDQLVHEEMLLKNLPVLLSGKLKYKKQSSKIKEVFFPKRTPEDGVIDWNWKTYDIYNLIRALDKPYPGAFTFYENKKIMIWKAIPFQLYPSFIKKKPGVVVASFYDGSFVVRTSDGCLLVVEYEWDGKVLKKNKKLSSNHNRSYDLLKKEGIL